MKFLVLIILFIGLAFSAPNKIFLDEDNINTSLDTSSSSSSSSTISSLINKNIDINNNLKLSELSIRSIKNIKNINNINSGNSININNVIEESVFDHLNNAKSFVESPECQNHLNASINGLKLSKQWAIAMYDSSVKVPVGIEYGVVYQFGNFDQCMSVNTQLDDDDDYIRPKYCLADVIAYGYNVRSVASRKMSQVPTQNVSTLIHWGICMPTSCTNNDIILYLSALTGYKDVSIRNNMCHINEPIKFNWTDTTYSCFMFSFVIMVLFSTIYHVYMIYRPSSTKARPRGCFEMILKSFSIIENLSKLGKSSSDELGLACINGMKAIAMFLIVAGHALVYMIGGPVNNASFYKHESQNIQNAFLLNSPLLVDSFLLLSGFLFARLLLLELNKRNGKVNFALLYIFRYIRLTPAYFAMIGLYATIMPKFGSGPLWDSRMGLEKERCLNSWWTNILYINNYIGTDKLCMFQSWYLAADTQLFVLAPLIIYPLWRWRKFGITLLGAISTISVIIPFIFTYKDELDPTFLIFADEVEDITTNDYFVTTYIKTHMRATAYIFGLLTGFLVHIIQEKNILLPKAFQYFAWITSILIGSGSMFAVIIFYNPDKQYTIFENALYAGLHRLGWSLATGWLVLSCVTGYAGTLKRLLSSRALIPISRLTYCAYLTNGLVELYQASTIQTPKYMSIASLTGETLSHCCLTFVAALILCLMFESPIHGLEKILLRREHDRKKTSNSPSTSEESA